MKHEVLQTVEIVKTLDDFVQDDSRTSLTIPVQCWYYDDTFTSATIVVRKSGNTVVAVYCKQGCQAEEIGSWHNVGTGYRNEAYFGIADWLEQMHVKHIDEEYESHEFGNIVLYKSGSEVIMEEIVS